MTEENRLQDGPEAAVSVGRRLAAARQKLGITVEEVAEKLKLLPRQIQAIEADDFGNLPGPVFARGFVRNYARLVNLDPEELLHSGQALARSTNVAVSARSERIPLPSGGGKRWLMISLGLVLSLVVLILLIYELLRGDVVVPGPLPVKPEAAAPATAEPSASLSPAPGSAAAPSTRVSAHTGGSVEQLPVAAASLPTDEPNLVFQFDQDSWVQVSDAYGEILRGLMPAGSTRIITGKPPFHLVVGNSRFVRLTYNGQPVDLASHTEVTVARLALE
jgi:cytoskeleton protein RodZ